MAFDPALGVEVRVLERPRHRQPDAHAVAYDAVDVGSRCYPVTDQAIGLAQQGPLQAVEDESLDLLVHGDRGHGGAIQQGVAAGDRLGCREGGGHDLDHPDQERRVARMQHQAAFAALDMVEQARRFDERGRAGDGAGRGGNRRHAGQEIAFQVDILGRVFLRVIGIRQGRFQIRRRDDAGHGGVRVAGNQIVGGQVAQTCPRHVESNGQA